jgi:hypothetical protein
MVNADFVSNSFEHCNYLYFVFELEKINLLAFPNEIYLQHCLPIHIIFDQIIGKLFTL